MYQSPFGPSTQQTTSGSGETKTEKISGTIKKEIIDILKENGIPSDVDAFLSKANDFLNSSTSLSSMSLFGGTNDDYSMSDLITIQKMANDVKWNKTQYDNAIRNLDAENAWGEIALDSRGWMYVSDSEGNISTVDPTKYNPEKQIALTNEQMMGMRERSSSFAMNSSVLNSMSGTVGMKTVQDYVIELVEKLGTSSLQGYASKEQSQIINGIRHLMEAGPDGYYRITDKQQARDVNSALHYLHNQLTPQMKKTLEATIAANGGNVQQDKYKFLGMILTQNVDNTFEADFDQSATKHELEQTGKDKSSGALGEVPYLVRIGRGDGQYEMVNISMRTDNVSNSGSMIAWAANMGDLVDKNGNVIGMDSLPNILGSVEAIKATRSKDITFGGQLLTDAEKNFIIYDGTSQLTDVWLPYKNVGGRITPDFDSLKAFNEWNDWVSKNPGLSKLEITNEAIKRGIDVNKLEYKDGSWKFKPSAMKLFLSFSAYADNDNVDFTNLTESLTEEMSNDFGKQYKEVFNNLFEYGKTHRTKSDKKTGLKYDSVRRWDIRKGNVFIPIDSDFLAMHMSMKQYAPKSTMNQFAARSTAAQEIANLKDDNIMALGQFR